MMQVGCWGVLQGCALCWAAGGVPGWGLGPNRLGAVLWRLCFACWLCCAWLALLQWRGSWQACRQVRVASRRVKVS